MSGKAGERNFHLFSVICPFGVNTGQGKQESEQFRAGRFWAYLVSGYLNPNVERRQEWTKT